MNKSTILVVAALIFDSESQVLITQRPEGQDLADYWEFPGGRVEPGETPQHALRREIIEELGIQISVRDMYFRDSFKYETKIVDLSFYLCKQINPRQLPRCIEVADMKWVPLPDLKQFKFPPADEALIRQLVEHNF